MSLSNTISSYGSLAKSFHWATVLLIFTTFPVGYFANDLAHQINSAGFDGDAGVIQRATFLFSLHKTLGVAALFTAILRILWAITQEKPGLLHPDNKPEALAAEVVHWLLYALMVLVPLSGWVMHASEVGYAPIWWPFGQGLPFVPKSETLAGLAGGFHWLMVWSLFTVVGLHVGGALKHHVIDRDMTLRRMLPFGGTAPLPPLQQHLKLPAPVAALVLGAVVLGGAQFGVLRGHDHSSHAAQEQHDHSTHDHGAHDHSAQGDTSVTSANAWIVESGSLGIEVQQMGSTIRGSFAKWDAAIEFTNPDAPGPAGSVVVDVEIASLSLGSVTTQALGTDYFNASEFPTARFEADLIRLENGYEARGTLTIRDQTQPFTLPFELEIDGGIAKMVGASSLQRLDYNVGLSQPDESTVGFGVEIKVELTARRGAATQEAAPTAANAWAVDTGSLGIEVQQMGSTIAGSFANWDAAIEFTNPDAPGPAGSVVVDVEIASLSLGSVTTQALGTDYFNASEFPTARFEAELIKLENGYEARGTLTIRDQTQPFTLPFELEIDGGIAKMVGSSSLQRLDYNVGLSQPDESTVGFGVGIAVELTARQLGS